jgi:hypothetical protein
MHYLIAKGVAKREEMFTVYSVQDVFDLYDAYWAIRVAEPKPQCALAHGQR